VQFHNAHESRALHLSRYMCKIAPRMYFLVFIIINYVLLLDVDPIAN